MCKFLSINFSLSFFIHFTRGLYKRRVLIKKFRKILCTSFSLMWLPADSLIIAQEFSILYTPWGNRKHQSNRVILN